MQLTYDRGDLSNLTSICYLIEPYSKRELKDRSHVALLLSKKNYHFLFVLNPQGTLIGYIMYLQTRKYIWLDFLKVLPKYQKQGYGKLMLDKLKSIANSLKIGLFVEVSSPDGDDYESELATQNWFIQREVFRLDVPYRLASEFGDTKACLFFYPSRRLSKLKGRTLENIIEESLEEIHSDVFTLDDTIRYLKKAIPNNQIYYSKRRF